MESIKVKRIQPIKDYNRKDYHIPVSFFLRIECEDEKLLEALRDKVLDWVSSK